MDPLEVTPADLDTFLDQGGNIDTGRATFLLGLATDLAASVVSPLPAVAKAIVLNVAARAYTNPEGIGQQTVGPFSVNRPFPGMYLTKAERRRLSRMGGRSGAFTVDPTPADASPAASWPAELLAEGFPGEGAPLW